MWNNEVTLIAEKVTQIDELGQAKLSERTITVLAQERQVTNAILFYAKQFDFKPSLVLAIHTYEYNNETFVIYNGERYKVKRAYKESDEITEIQCERVINK